MYWYCERIICGISLQDAICEVRCSQNNIDNVFDDDLHEVRFSSIK